MNHFLPLRLWAASAGMLFAIQGLAAAEETPARKMPELSVDSTPVGRAGVVTSYADVLDPMRQTVVTIKATKNAVIPRGRPGAGPMSGEAETSLGSGVIVSKDGYILTNNHVVSDADKLDVEIGDQRHLRARLVGADPKTDVAVIKIDGEIFSAITLADSDQIRVGDLVFAIGNPLEIGQTVTMGIVSAKGRTVGLLSNETVQGYEDFIQTDAAINLGNSGGALVDAKGRLIGINSAIASTSRSSMGGNIGIGFAVPINLAAKIMKNLIETGTVSHGYLGVYVDEFDVDVAEVFGLKRDTRGVVINEVIKEAPAAKAGLQKDDVITSIDGRSVGSRSEFGLIVSQKDPGSTAKVSYVRGGKELTVEIVLAQLPADTGAPDELLPDVTVQVLTADMRRSLGMDNSLEGVIVTAIGPKSAEYNNLQEGMVILEINAQRFTDLASARRLLKKPGDNRFLVMGDRNATPRWILIRIK